MVLAAEMQPFEQIPILDVDTHVMEPHDLWTSRVSKKWGDAVPFVADDEFGRPRWYVGGVATMMAGSLTSHPWYDEVTRKGGFDPSSRLEWMDRHGIHAQILYPNVIGFFIKNFLGLDPELRLECIRAYNDFQTEFASVAPDRLIPLANLPWWDMEAALAELQRCHDMGHKGLNFAWRFNQIGFPPLRDDHWEPLLKTVEEMGWSVNLHVGFGGDPDDDPVLQFGSAKLFTIEKAKQSAELFAGNIACIAELIMGRICHRYPTLKFVSVESGVGYIPYLLDGLDWQFLNMNLPAEHPDMLLPSEYFRRQIYACFWFERGVGHAAERFPDNFMFETDYNHSTSLTPADALPYVTGPRETLAKNLKDVPIPLVRKLIHDNAAAVYGLPKAAIG